MCSPLILMGCGEGWEMQRVDNIAPYGNSRTAGKGVAYVRVKMLPEKDMNLESVMEVEEEVSEVIEEVIEEETVIEEFAEVVEESPEVEPVLDAEEIFTDAQIKGGSAAVNDAVEVDYGYVEEEAVIGEVYNEVEDAVIEKTPEEIIEEVSAGLTDEDSDNSFDISVEAPDAANIQPEAGGYDDDLFSEDMTTYESEIDQPAQEDTAPKRGFFNFMSNGQENIDDIYGDPLDDK